MYLHQPWQLELLWPLRGRGFWTPDPTGQRSRPPHSHSQSRSTSEMWSMVHGSCMVNQIIFNQIIFNIDVLECIKAFNSMIDSLAPTCTGSMHFTFQRHLKYQSKILWYYLNADVFILCTLKVLNFSSPKEYPNNLLFLKSFSY